MNPNQLARDIALAIVWTLAGVTYHRILHDYLSALDRPFVFEAAFLFSLLMAYFYELRSDAPWRMRLIGCCTTTLVFLAGAWLGTWFRAEYLQFLGEVKGNTNFINLVGDDLYAVFTARAVGYAGCFAVGLMVARLTIRSIVSKALNRLLLIQSNRPMACPCCGQLTSYPLGEKVRSSP